MVRPPAARWRERGKVEAREGGGQRQKARARLQQKAGEGRQRGNPRPLRRWNKMKKGILLQEMEARSKWRRARTKMTSWIMSRTPVLAPTMLREGMWRSLPKKGRRWPSRMQIPRMRRLRPSHPRNPNLPSEVWRLKSPKSPKSDLPRSPGLKMEEWQLHLHEGWSQAQSMGRQSGMQSVRLSFNSFDPISSSTARLRTPLMVGGFQIVFSPFLGHNKKTHVLISKRECWSHLEWWDIMEMGYISNLCPIATVMSFTTRPRHVIVWTIYHFCFECVGFIWGLYMHPMKKRNTCTQINLEKVIWKFGGVTFIHP